MLPSSFVRRVPGAVLLRARGPDLAWRVRRTQGVACTWSAVSRRNDAQNLVL